MSLNICSVLEKRICTHRTHQRIDIPYLGEEILRFPNAALGERSIALLAWLIRRGILSIYSFPIFLPSSLFNSNRNEPKILYFVTLNLRFRGLALFMGKTECATG